MNNIYYHRNIEVLLRKALMNFPVVVITGARQTGKSTMLKNILPDFRYVTLDDPVQRQLIKEDPGSVLHFSDKPVIIDEIQYAPEILSHVKMFVDGNRGRKGLIVLTGSQNFSLIEDVTESLAGRAAVLTLPVFSVSEYSIEGINKAKDCYNAMLRGFYPDPLLHGTDISLFYSSYLQTYLERDVRQVSEVSNLNTFQAFITMLASRSGSIINLNELARECGIAFNTAKKWLSILSASGIFFLLKPYFRNITKRVIKSPKLYINDTGLMAYILKYKDPETLFASSLSGSFFETFIINEFLKFSYNNNAVFELYYFRDSNGNEIDLILEFEGRYLLFEIKSSQTLRLEHAKNLKKLLPIFPGGKGFLLGFYENETRINKDITATNWINLVPILDKNLGIDMQIPGRV